MTPERSIAIAFIKQFRENMDDMLRPLSEAADRERHLEESLEPYVAYQLGVSEGSVDEELLESIKNIVLAVSESLIEIQAPLYEKLLTTIVSDVMHDIEVHLRENYSQEDLEFFAEIVNDERMQRLLGDNGIFGMLRTAHGNAKKELTACTLNFLNDEDGFSPTMMDYMLKFGLGRKPKDS
tara:strand:- start:20288 stop:20830 length:543 start_codon:yes stop_codon:yes gene_type:complete